MRSERELDGWTEAPLGKITAEENRRVGHGKAPTVMSSTKHFGLVPSDQYFKNRTIYSSDLSNYKSLEDGWFAYATNHLAEGSIGLYRGEGEACVSPIYTVFSCSPEVFPEYLFRLLKTPNLVNAYRKHEQASVDRRGAVRYRDFGKIVVSIPPFADQLRIEDILKTLDDVIQQTEQTVMKIEQVKQGLLFDLLTRGIDDNGELRDPDRHPEQFKNSPLGAIPREWKVSEIGEVAEVLNGTTPSRARADYWTGGSVPWLSSGKVNEYRVTTPSELVTARATRECGLRVLPIGTVIIGMIGQGRTRGMSARLELAAAINQNLAAVVPSASLDGGYAHLYLHGNYERLRGGGRGSNQDALNCRLVARFRICVPPLHEQRAIATRVVGLERREDAERGYLQKLKDLKPGLVDDLLEGRVRTKVSKEDEE